MTTAEVAAKLVEMNRQQMSQEIYDELYVAEPVSIENWGDREVHEGAEAIKKKAATWEAGVVEVHEVRVSEPLVADKSFAVTFYMDITYNESMGPEMAGRSQMTELAVYKVNDEGKIYQEEFMA